MSAPAGSCILSNAPIDACAGNCCAKKGCCKVFQKGKAPALPPLTKRSTQRLTITLVASPIEAVFSGEKNTERLANANPVAQDEDSPPLLPFLCTFLI
jgi:hypothetical protein